MIGSELDDGLGVTVVSDGEAVGDGDRVCVGDAEADSDFDSDGWGVGDSDSEGVVEGGMLGWLPQEMVETAGDADEAAPEAIPTAKLSVAESANDAKAAATGLETRISGRT